MPIVAAKCGTREASPLAVTCVFCTIVSCESGSTRVGSFPNASTEISSSFIGSLKAMCPLKPMPRSCRSSPPAAAIAGSYFSGASGAGKCAFSSLNPRAGSNFEKSISCMYRQYESGWSCATGVWSSIAYSSRFQVDRSDRSAFARLNLSARSV